MITEHIRKDIIKLNNKLAGNLSSVELFTGLLSVLKKDDNLIVADTLKEAYNASFGHAGKFGKSKISNMPLKTYKYPLGAALGMALASEMDGKHSTTYCIVEEQEHNNGTHWEAIMFAAKHKLPVTLIISRHNTQPTGYTENISPLEPLAEKYLAFNWKTTEVDGHDIQHITEALRETKKPHAIIAHTTAGKGLLEIEHNYEYHHKTL